MVLGFMSLILTVIQRAVARICIPQKIAHFMLPCSQQTKLAIITKVTAPPQTTLPPLNLSSHCQSQGKASLISEEGMNQLSIFIFVLAVMHIVSSVLTMALGRAKMRRWKSWENETRTIEYQVANDPNRFRLTRETTFGRRHTNSCTSTWPQLWIKCFFRQFFNSVAKVDYLTLRHGFISAHSSINHTAFNFQKYIERSLEDDFKVVVGIRPVMWIVMVIFMLLNAHGWHEYIWLSFLPLVIVAVVGTKMEVIVENMGLKVNEKGITKGTPLVQPNDAFFWFGHPKHILTLLHFILFMNAFEATFLTWVTLQLGIKSCYLQHIEYVIVRAVLAVSVQLLCSYITLPLFALVTQMGSEYKSGGVVDEEIGSILKQWHADVRKKRLKHPQQQQQCECDDETETNNDNNIA